jgi:hypothetical protein
MPDGEVELSLQTYFSEEGHESSVPRGLWVDVRGHASHLTAAIDTFANLGNYVASYLAVAANASIEELQPELAYDSSVGLTEREYFQQFLPADRGLPRISRRIDPALPDRLFTAIKSHGDAERLNRAVQQYAFALRNWRIGRETIAVAHLWMGLEGLTQVAKRLLRDKANISEEEWKALVGLGDEFRDAAIRRAILFQGDAKCYSDAKQVSEGFEHGFAEFAELRELAVGTRVSAANYLRAAILGLSNVGSADATIMLAPPFDIPFEATQLARYLKGRVTGAVQSLPAQGQVYPFIRWSTRMTRFARDTDGRYSVSIAERYVPRIGKGVTFQPERLEVWGPETGRSARDTTTSDMKVFSSRENLTEAATPKEHATQLVEGIRGANVSPSYTAAKIESRRLEDLIDVFEDRIRGWYLSKAYLLDSRDENSAYAVLQLAASVLVAVERCRTGQVEDGHERELFVSAFQLAFAFDPRSSPDVAPWFSRIPELIHQWLQALPLSQAIPVLVNVEGPLPMRAVGSDDPERLIIEINPQRFLDAVAAFFQDYVRQLREAIGEPAESLRTNFLSATS